MKFSLAGSFSLRQLLEPRQILPCVLDAARSSIAHKLQNELHPLQRWIETHEQKRIELRLECIRLDDLVVALPIVDLGLREGMKHYEVKCALVLGYLPVIVRLLDRNEVFIERNMEFSRKDLLRVKCVFVPELL